MLFASENVSSIASQTFFVGPIKNVWLARLECEQDTSPTTEEKIQLAQLNLNLGCKKLVFGSESDATEVHDCLFCLI